MAYQDLVISFLLAYCMSTTVSFMVLKEQMEEFGSKVIVLGIIAGIIACCIRCFMYLVVRA